MNVFVLTGAGVSAESGVPTFRDADGLWEQRRFEDVATPEAFRRDRALVRRFYDARRRALLSVEPNAAHRALARLGRELRGGSLFLCTQNIDDLHERGGSADVVHMHGELRKARCLACGRSSAWDTDMGADDLCPACGAPDSLRPDVVWFGEIPLHMDAIEAALAQTDLFAAIGTSGSVYPAAGFVQLARRAGARTVEINAAISDNAPWFSERRLGLAGTAVPAWVEDILARPGAG